MASFHVRSTSFPSKSHPLIVSIEDQLHKLKKSESLSIGLKLAGLKQLYDSVDDYLQMSFAYENNQCVAKALDGSIRVLDICSTTRDVLSQMKESVRGLESSLRRRRRLDAESSLNEVDAYMAARKKLNQAINKYLRNFKKCTLSDDSNMLRDPEEISVSVFESILCLVSQTNAKSKLSVFSKLLHSKKSSSEEETEANEVEKIDAELIVFKSNKDINQIVNVMRGLEAFELRLQQVEEELDCVYRQLVKTRVSLLNILSH